MNLVGEEDSGPQFFSPGRIQRAQDLQNEKEAHAQAEGERIAEKKVQAVINKAQKEAAKAERALQAEARRQLVAEEKVRKTEERAAKQAARQALLAEKKAQLEARRAAKQVPKARSILTTAARTSKKHTVVEIQGSPKRVVIVGSGHKTCAQAVIPPSCYE